MRPRPRWLPKAGTRPRLTIFRTGDKKESRCHSRATVLHSMRVGDDSAGGRHAESKTKGRAMKKLCPGAACMLGTFLPMAQAAQKRITGASPYSRTEGNDPKRLEHLGCRPRRQQLDPVSPTIRIRTWTAAWSPTDRRARTPARRFDGNEANLLDESRRTNVSSSPRETGKWLPADTGAPGH